MFVCCGACTSCLVLSAFGPRMHANSGWARALAKCLIAMWWMLQLNYILLDDNTFTRFFSFLFVLFLFIFVKCFRMLQHAKSSRSSQTDIEWWSKLKLNCNWVTTRRRILRITFSPLLIRPASTLVSWSRSVYGFSFFVLLEENVGFPFEPSVACLAHWFHLGIEQIKHETDWIIIQLNRTGPDVELSLQNDSLSVQKIFN